MATKDISDLLVCLAYQEYHEEYGKWPYEILAGMTGQHWKVCFRACERADKRGLIDYGTSLRSGWLTEKGNALIDEASRSPRGVLDQEVRRLRQDPNATEQQREAAFTALSSADRAMCRECARLPSVAHVIKRVAAYDPISADQMRAFSYKR